MKRLKFALASVIVVMSSVVAPIAIASATPAGGTCQSVTLRVALSDGGVTDQSVSGTLCQPDVWADGTHQLDVLVHGATYNRQYWDWPVDPSTYSYVQRNLQAGRATFAYDRLGDGQSSRPLGAALNLVADAAVLHQIILWLHSQGFSSVNAVGHSLGSAVAMQEAGTPAYSGDINRLVLTGLLHAQGTSAAQFFTSVTPAALDPQFFGKITDLTYLTTAHDTRGSLFYNPTADPNVVAYDELHKDVVASGELSDLNFLLGLTLPVGVSLHVTVPTLLVVGQDDKLVCGLAVDCSMAANIQAHEAAYFPNVASLTSIVVPNTGHDIALHPSAATSFADIHSWLLSH